MSHTIRNEQGLIIFSTAIGIAGGLAAILLAGRMKRSNSIYTSNVVGVSLLLAAATLASVYLVKLSEEEPHLP